jgi:cell division protein FtsB
MDWLKRFRRVGELELPEDPPTDARTAEGVPRVAEDDPEAELRDRVRRRVGRATFLSVFVISTGVLLVGEDGLVDRMRLGRELRGVEARVDEQRRQVEELRDEVRGLHDDPMARERIAREQLGYARRGEILLLLPEEPAGPSEAPADPGAAPTPARP